jgi:hypothetical protein
MIASFAIRPPGGGHQYIWGWFQTGPHSPKRVIILGTAIPVYRLMVIVISFLVYFGIWLFLNRTITGKAIRRIEDVEHVEGLGINVYKLFTITFILAGTLSASPGPRTPLIMVDPHMGPVLAFVFMVAIIGGLGSIKEPWPPPLSSVRSSPGILIYAPGADGAFAIMLLILLTADGSLRQQVAETISKGSSVTIPGGLKVERSYEAIQPV